MAQSYISARKFEKLQHLLTEYLGEEHQCMLPDIANIIATVLNYNPEKYQQELSTRREATRKTREKLKTLHGTTYDEYHKNYYDKFKDDINLKKAEKYRQSKNTPRVTT